jgi:hypothetical protein
MLEMTMTMKNKAIFAMAVSVVLLIGTVSASYSVKIADNDKQQLRTDLKTAHEKIGVKLIEHSQKIAKGESISENDIPFVISWIDDATDTLKIGIDSDYLKTNDEVSTQKIKEVLGVDVPFAVTYGKISRDGCASRTSYCDPVIGGIQVSVPSNPEYGSSTVTIAAKKGSTQGFVMSGHGAYNTGYSVYQPTSSPSSNYFGTVDTISNWSTTDTSDSAFVKDLTSSRNAAANIYRTSSTQYTVTGYATPSYQTHVQLTGYVSGERDGYVISSTPITVSFDGSTLTDQIVANYITYGGDSGAPVYSYRTSAGPVTLYGIHVGTYCITPGDCPAKFFSKWSNVQTDLGVTLP